MDTKVGQTTPFDEVTYCGFNFKIQIVAKGEAFRIMLKIPDITDQHVDITNQITTEFATKLFAEFFRIPTKDKGAA
jgi:hypothetical protein